MENKPIKLSKNSVTNLVISNISRLMLHNKTIFGFHQSKWKTCVTLSMKLGMKHGTIVANKNRDKLH